MHLHSLVGGFYMGLGDKTKAEKSYTTSTSIAKENFGEKHVLYAKQLSELGHAQAMQGNYALAEKTLLSSLNIFEFNKDNSSLEYASLQAYRASMYRYKNEYHIAEPLFREAITIYKKDLDKDPEHNYGLQRAFFVAGTKSLIVSLWKVNDEATQLLMTNFYQNWITKKQDKYTALLNAQKEIQKKYPDPYYWGAFILLGK